MASLPVTAPEPATARSTAVPATWGALLRGALVVVVTLLLVGALGWIIFGVATDDFVGVDARRVGERNKILADRNAEDAKLLHDPASWQDRGKGIARVPIERAVDLAMADLQKVAPHPAYPLTQSPPQPANAPAAAGAAPAPSAPVSPATPAPAPASMAPAAAVTPASVPPATSPVPVAAPVALPSAAPAPSADSTPGSKPVLLMPPPITPTPAPGAPGANPAETP